MSLLKSGAALSFARLANQAVVFIGPIILVRLLSIQDYGVYREFFVYATIAGTLGSAAVNRSLLYLLPKYPKSEKRLVTLSTLFVLCCSTAVAAGFVLLSSFTGLLGDFPFAAEVAIYLIVFLNFDYVECFWLAKGQVRQVVSYTLIRSAARLVAAICAAYIFSSAESIILSLIAVEGLRLLYVLFSTLRNYRGLDSREHRPKLAVEQIVFFSPLALMASLEAINMNIGQLIVSSELGEESLALYFVGSYAVLVANLLYSSVSDLLFPKVVERATDDHFASLLPWRHMTNLYLVIMLAVTAIGYMHANEIISLLFSPKYLPAAAVFQLLIFGTLILSFDFNFVIRSLNKNFNSLIGYSILIPVNLIISYALIGQHGLLAPAYAYLIAQATLALYLGWRVKVLTGLSIGRMLEWAQLGRIIASFLIALIALHSYIYLVDTGGIVHAAISSIVFLAIYLLAMKALKVNTLNYFVSEFDLAGNAKPSDIATGNN